MGQFMMAFRIGDIVAVIKQNIVLKPYNFMKPMLNSLILQVFDIIDKKVTPLLYLKFAYKWK